MLENFDNQTLEDKLMKTTKRKLLLTGLTAVALVLAAFLAYTAWDARTGDQAMVCTGDNEGPLLRRAAEAFVPGEPERMAELGRVAEEIERQDGYENDINCLYPVMVHYLYSGERKSAAGHLPAMKEAHAEGQAVSQLFGYRMSIEDIEARIEHLAVVEEQVKENTIYLE